VFINNNFSIVPVMENIIEPNENFEFQNLSLSHPSGVQGGAYFTKLQYNGKPLYIQTNKSLTRQGFVKNGKKYYCDLMFDKNSETLINWFENLETTCQKLILEKSNLWFQNPLAINDIESAFNSTIRIYKSGKYYLVRTNVKNNSSNEPSIKIYDENELPLGIDDITVDKEIISILEIQGIKFTSRNFQIEIELKQVMALNNEPIFESCLIKTTKPKRDFNEKISNNVENSLGNNFIEKPLLKPSLIDNSILPLKPSLVVEDKNRILAEQPFVDKGLSNNTNDEEDEDSDSDSDNNSDSDSDSDNIKETLTFIDDNKNDNLLEFDITDLDEKKEEINEITELDLNMKEFAQNNLETFILKKPNQVYFELYKEAKNKAKEAKKAAIIAYLEAKNIRKTYMLDNLNDSDSDFDEEIEEVSESELENL
jgi:hypothetical protein